MAFLNISVEVPMFLSFFSFILTLNVYTNLVIFRTCYLILGYNETECALLGNANNNETEKLEKLVEPHATVINMVRGTTDSVFTVLLCLFIGPWSDRFGRKPVLVVNLLGGALSQLATSLFCYFPNISPWYLILCGIPGMLTGGTASYITVVLSYITDISTEESRGIRMAIFEAVFGIGSLLGNILSPYLFYATSYTVVFAIAAGVTALGALYTIFFIPESLQNRETEGLFQGFFNVSNFMEMVKITIKRRQYFYREIILLNLAILTIHMFVISGDSGLTFYYLREKFGWTLTKYTVFSSVRDTIWIVGTLLGTYFLHKIFHIREAILVLWGCITTVMGSLLQGLGNKDWYIYAASGVRCLGGLISPMSRSLISKLVPGDEIGKIFAIITASEFILGMGASPLYTAVYNTTIDKDPGVYNYVTAGLYTCNIILTIAILIVQNIKPSTYEQLSNEQNDEIPSPVSSIN